jgi:menaquinone-dependent protoporphyrinogen IX oxidase
MNIWIIYDSKFGNNKRVAEALAEEFKAGNVMQISHAKHISPKKVMEAGIDVFLFGGPLRAGNISFTMKRWAGKLAGMLKKRQKTLAIAAVWGSHAVNAPDTPPQFSWNASKGKWKALLDTIPAEKKIDEVISFEVQPTTLAGPLVPGWEEIAKNFAHRVKSL